MLARRQSWFSTSVANARAIRRCSGSFSWKFDFSSQPAADVLSVMHSITLRGHICFSWNEVMTDTYAARNSSALSDARSHRCGGISSCQAVPVCMQYPPMPCRQASVANVMVVVHGVSILRLIPTCSFWRNVFHSWRSSITCLAIRIGFLGV